MIKCQNILDGVVFEAEEPADEGGEDVHEEPNDKEGDVGSCV